MSGKNNWFFSMFCTKCGDPKEEAKSEMIIDSRSATHPIEKSKTTIRPLKPLKKKKVSPGNVDNEYKTQSSTKDQVAVDSKLIHNTESTSSTPRFDIELEVLESDYLQASKKFLIKSSGFLNNNKLSTQGRVYIGSEVVSRQDLDGQVDIVCAKYKSMNSIKSACLDFDGVNFQLKELGGGDGVYIKAEEKLALEHRNIVHYGIGHFAVELDNLDEKARPLLKLKFLDGPNEGIEKMIEPGQDCTFGRASTCTFVFDEYGLSRNQCKLYFENDQWFVVDGDGTKKSTNGTWLLLQDKKKVFDKMIFKVCSTVFKINFIDATQERKEL